MGLGDNMRDRFDLEQEIMTCWNVVDDLKFYVANSDRWTADEQMNYINGLTVKYDKRFDHMFSIFEECVSVGVFKPMEPMDSSIVFSGLESAYDPDAMFNSSLQDLNDGYYPGN